MVYLVHGSLGLRGSAFKFNPRHPKKTLNRSSPKFTYMITSEIAITPANFIQIGLGISFLRMRDFAHPLIVSAFFRFFGSSNCLQPRRAPVLTRNRSKDAVPRNDVPFGHLSRPNLLQVSRS